MTIFYAVFMSLLMVIIRNKNKSKYQNTIW